ncbi:hypothetical protein, partial [Paraburkholderia ferrariae]
MPSPKDRPTPKIGTVFEKKYKEKIYKLKVVKHEDRVLYQLGKELFPSPSAAAKSLSKTEVNG